MANAVEFILSLKDKLTGPARGAKKSLDAIRSSLKSVDAVSKATGGADVVTGRFGRMKNAAAGLAGKLPSVGAMASGLGSAFSTIGPVILAVGAALAAVGVGGLGLVAAGAKYASEMAGFKEQTLFAYKYILGSKEKASMMFAEADALARAMGGATTKTAESMRELMGGGFSQTQSKNITAAIGDVAALNPTADTSAISAQLAQMKGAGRVLAEDLKPLLNAGLNDDIFYQVLREMTGKTDQKDLKKMLETGKVSADQGIDAILETVNRMGGSKGLGSVAAARANETMQGQIDSAKAMFERLFMSISSGPAGASVGKLAQQVSSFLDPKGSSGQRILAILDSVAGGVGEVLASLQGGALGDLMGGFLSFFEAVRPVSAAFFGAFGAGIKEAFGATKAIFSAFSSGAGPTLDMVGIAKALGSAFAWVAVGIGATVAVLVAIVGAIGLVVVGIGTAIVDLVGWIGTTAGSISTEAWSIAGAFITGLVDGITGGTISVITAVVAMGTAAVDAVKGVFQIKSPSRVMYEIGGYTAEGFAMGVDAGAPDASAAVASMVAPPALASFGGGSGGGGALSLGGITVQINGVDASNADAVGAATTQAVEEAMRNVFARWGVELGTAPAAV